MNGRRTACEGNRKRGWKATAALAAMTAMLVASMVTASAAEDPAALRMGVRNSQISRLTLNSWGARANAGTGATGSMADSGKAIEGLLAAFEDEEIQSGLLELEALRAESSDNLAEIRTLNLELRRLQLALRLQIREMVPEEALQLMSRIREACVEDRADIEEAREEIRTCRMERDDAWDRVRAAVRAGDAPLVAEALDDVLTAKRAIIEAQEDLLVHKQLLADLLADFVEPQA